MDLYYSIVSPPCQTVLLVAKKLGITFNLKETNPHLPEVRENLKKINPQHTIPTLVDDGHVIYESYAIVIYLIEKYGKDDSLYPKDPKVRSVVNQRLFFDNGLLFRSTIEHVECLVRKTRQMTDEIGAKLKKALGILETYVTERPFAAADHLTIADICLLSNVTTLGMMQYDLEPYPGIKAWLAKVTGEFPDYAEFHKELVDTTMQYLASLKPSN